MLETLKVGVVTLVIPSLLLDPLSLAGWSTGAAGVDGATVSMVMDNPRNRRSARA